MSKLSTPKVPLCYYSMKIEADGSLLISMCEPYKTGSYYLRIDRPDSNVYPNSFADFVKHWDIATRKPKPKLKMRKVKR